MRKIFIIITLFTFHCGFTLDIYVPQNGAQKEERILLNATHSNTFVYYPEKSPGFTLPDSIIIEDKRHEKFTASHKPCLFFLSGREFNDERKTLQDVIKHSFENRPEYYFGGSKTSDPLKIIINRFNVSSRDYCTYNIVTVNADMEVYRGDSPAMFFRFQKEENLKTPVTTMLLYSVIWTIPTAVKAGFNGNREDQINYLARRTLAEFTEGLAASMNPEQQQTGENLDVRGIPNAP